MMWILLCFLFSIAWAEEPSLIQKPSTSKETESQLPKCFFSVPKGWERIEKTPACSRVKMAFVKKSKKEGFWPSLNLAVEEVEGSLQEYLNDIKAIHERDRNNQWRKLGKVHTLSGEAQLTQIDTASVFGPVRMLQLILLKEGYVYIITAAALKNEFCDFYRDFQEAFHSLTISLE